MHGQTLRVIAHPPSLTLSPSHPYETMAPFKTLLNGTPVLAVDALFKRASALDADAVLTDATLRALQRLARQSAWDAWHARTRRSFGVVAVVERACIRGRDVALRLVVSNHGATVRRDWRVDGRRWRAADVFQTFGA